MGKKNPKATKARSGQITLRVSPEQHGELVAIADGLGLDVNGLLRLMIGRTIEHFRLEAMLLQEQGQENLNLLNLWKQDNPGKPIREFWDHYWTYWAAKRGKQAWESGRGFNFETAEQLARQAAGGKEGES